MSLDPIAPGWGAYRWLDCANQGYSVGYINSYAYDQAAVTVTYSAVGNDFHGTLSALNLKPNFAYEIKLQSEPGTPENERLGLVGRWWQETWSGTAWGNGYSLNDKGSGSSPNPNDLTYYSRRDITSASSPTGLLYRYAGYILFAGFITDAYGNATVEFGTGDSFHVLWKTAQRARVSDDGAPMTYSFAVDPALHTAYSTDYAPQTVTVFGEWERLPGGEIDLIPGDYEAMFLLTEESFHGDGGVNGGQWAGAMCGPVNFTIAPASANLAVVSTPYPAVAIAGNPAGVTPYAMEIDKGSTIVLTAPPTTAEGRFLRWTLNGLARENGLRTAVFVITADTTAAAAYDPYRKGDLTRDWVVADFWDFMFFCDAYGATVTDMNYDRLADFDNDDAINFWDFMAFSGIYGS